MAASKQSGPRVLFQHQLRKRRHKRKPAPRPRAPELTVAQILGWADDWHARTGRWPIKSDGRIVSGLGETWAKINSALRQGLRGLPGGSSLPRLLAQHRAVSNRKALPHFTIAGILRWTDGYHQRTGNWPNRDSGPVAGDSRETWFKVDRALQNGGRGLSGRSSLAKVLARYRGVRNPANLAGYSIQAILRWADAYRDRAVGQVYNIGTGENTTLLDLVHHLNLILATRIQPVHGPVRPGDVRHSKADISMARKELRYEPTTSFLEGLQITVEAFKKNGVSISVSVRRTPLADCALDRRAAVSGG